MYLIFKQYFLVHENSIKIYRKSIKISVLCDSDVYSTPKNCAFFLHTWIFMQIYIIENVIKEVKSRQKIRLLNKHHRRRYIYKSAQFINEHDFTTFETNDPATDPGHCISFSLQISAHKRHCSFLFSNELRGAQGVYQGQREEQKLKRCRETRDEAAACVQ